MESANIVYQTKNISDYYGSSRVRWDHFYPSERTVIEYVNPRSSASVIDMGCACGGLGLALKERFGITQYVGVDINSQAIEVARKLQPDATFFAADFLQLEDTFVDQFDLAFSLSCADWNVQTIPLLKALFRSVKSDGQMIVSCRLTDSESVPDVIEARQKIVFGANDEVTEWAPYKVYRLKTFLDIFMRLEQVGEIYGFGYWGNKPPTVEGLNFEQIFYVVFALKKSRDCISPRLKLELPGLLQFDLE